MEYKINVEFPQLGLVSDTGLFQGPAFIAWNYYCRLKGLGEVCMCQGESYLEITYWIGFFYRKLLPRKLNSYYYKGVVFPRQQVLKDRFSMAFIVHVECLVVVTQGLRFGAAHQVV